GTRPQDCASAIPSGGSTPSTPQHDGSTSSAWDRCGSSRQEGRCATEALRLPLPVESEPAISTSSQSSTSRPVADATGRRRRCVSQSLDYVESDVFSPVASRYQATTFRPTARSRLVHLRPVRLGHFVCRRSCRKT